MLACLLTPLALVAKQHAGDTLTTWLRSHGGSLSSRVHVAPSAPCGGGLGVFASSPLALGEELGTIPLEACISYSDAYANEEELGEEIRSRLPPDAAFGQASVAVAALLAYARWAETPGGETLRRQWGEYIDTLPWEVAEQVAADGAASFASDAALREADALRAETDASGDEEDLSGSIARWRRMHVARARGYAKGVQALLGGRLPLEACWAALWLVESRAFDLGPYGGNSCVMVPWLDIFNHPSASALRAHGAAGAAFASAASRLAGCISWTAELEQRDADKRDDGDDDGDDGGDEDEDEELGRVRGRRRSKPKAVVVRAPRELPVGAGDELWNWYESAGFGTSNPEEWARGEAQFLAQYGFSPWD